MGSDVKMLMNVLKVTCVEVVFVQTLRDPTLAPDVRQATEFPKTTRAVKILMSANPWPPVRMGSV